MKKTVQQYLTLIFLFILGNHNGYIALWKTTDPQPVQIFPYSVSTLPPADQQALEKGIPIASIEQLHRLLEDYLS